MKQCINCLSENVSTIMEKNHLFYYCPNCKQKNSRVIDHEGNNYSEKINNLIKHVTVGAIIEEKGKILLVSRNLYPYGLGIPASHLHYGEDVEDTLKRLFLDKIGLTLKSKKIIFHQTIIDPCRYGGELHDWYIFKCEVEDHKSIGIENNLVWVPLSELNQANLIHSAKTLFSRLGYLDEKNDIVVPTPVKNKPEDLSVLDSLPIAIITMNNKKQIEYENRMAKNILAVIKKNKKEYEKFINSAIDLGCRSIESDSNISGNIKFDMLTYNIFATPLDKKGGNEPARCSITIRDITDQRIQKAKDVLAYQASLALCANSSFSNIIKTLLQQLFYSLDITGCSLMIREGEKLKVTHRYSKTQSNKRQPRELKIGEGVAGWVAEKGTPLAIPDTNTDPIFVHSNSKHPRSLLAVPVISNDQVLGVLNVTKYKNTYFTEDEMKMVTIVANRIALAIENENLYTSLREEKQTLETVLTTTTDGLILLDRDLKLVFSNHAAKKMINLTENEIENHHIKNFLKRKSKENVKKFLESTHKSIDRKKHISIDLVSNKGHEKILKVVFNPIIDKSGSCNSVLVGFNDITKIKKKERLIQKQISQITALFKITSLTSKTTEEFIEKILRKTTVILSSSETSLLMFDGSYSKNKNELAQKMINKLKRIIPEDGLISNSFSKDFSTHPKDFSASRAIVAPIIVDKKNIGIILSKDKKTNYTANDLKLLNIIAGRLARKIESDMFIRQIEDDRKKISNIIENTGDGIVVLDKNFHALIWNKAMETITGFHTFQDLIKNNSESLVRIKKLNEEAEKNRKNKFHYEAKIRNSENQEVWIGVTYAVIRHNQEIEYSVAMIRDISQEKKMENQQKEFLYTATHELRTPITAIKGYLSMILNGDAGEINSKQRMYFDRVYNSTDRLISLVEDLLNVARLEEDSIHFDIEPFKAHQLVEEVVKDFAGKAAEKKINLTISNDSAKDLELLGDYTKTKHALFNLVENALKYSRRGQIEISLHQLDKAGLISVQDTGVGIPKRELPLIFNKFYRVKNSESVRAGGTGLGLFIVKNLIEKQNGKIGIESQLGKGTKIYFTLPINN